MKQINRIFLLFFLFVTSTSFAQNVFKIGPSTLININFFNERIVIPLGGEIGYEFRLNDYFSVNFAGSIHFIEHRSRFRENRINKINEKELFLGTQLDIRYHFKALYQGSYIGIGADAKYWNAKNYFPASTDGDPNAIASDNELNIGMSYGVYIPLKYGYLNPNIYIGGNPTDQNEYELHAKLGLNYAF